MLTLERGVYIMRHHNTGIQMRGKGNIGSLYEHKEGRISLMLSLSSTKYIYTFLYLLNHLYYHFDIFISWQLFQYYAI